MAKAVDIGVFLQGDAELAAKFRLLAFAVQKKVSRPALRIGAKLIADSVKRHVPRVTGKRTDVIRKNIRIRAIRRSRTGIGLRILTPWRSELHLARLKNLNPNRFGFRLYQKPIAVEKGYYPAAIEFGTTKTPAIPFMRPGFAAAKGSASIAIREGIRAGIERLAATK